MSGGEKTKWPMSGKWCLTTPWCAEWGARYCDGVISDGGNKGPTGTINFIQGFEKYTTYKYVIRLLLLKQFYISINPY